MAKEVAKLEGKKIDNPYEMATKGVAVSAPGTAMSASESQRAMIEVMTSFEVAKRFPRDPKQAMDAILAECGRPTLAEVAVYSFPRGKTEITGPSIRLMEAIARGWKNIQFGFKVLERRQGSSSIQAFARDLETNTFIERTFDVRHWRDTKEGGYMIKDERDIYELEANMAQRRVRSCIIGLIPGDVIDTAVEQCDFTTKNSIDTSPEGIKKIVKAFESYGVNEAMIEAKFQCKLTGLKPTNLTTLRRIFASLKDGMGAASDFFDISLATKKKALYPELGAAKEEQGEEPDLKEDIKEAEGKKAVKEKAKKDPAPAKEEKGASDFERIRENMLGAKTLTALDDIWGDGDSGVHEKALKLMSAPEWNKLREIYEGRKEELEKE